MKRYLIVIASFIALASPSFAFATKAFQVDTGGTLTNGLAAYYKMETSSVDFYSTNNGVDTGSPTYSAGNGMVNNGVGLVRNTDLINIGSSSALHSDTFSFAGWIKWNGVGNAVITSQIAPTNGVTLYVKSTGVIDFDKDGAIVLAVSGAPAVSSSSWNFIVLSYTSSTGAGNVYVQNASVATSTASTTFTWASTGFSRTANSIGFGGSMDELGWWNRVLTAQEMTDLYNGGTGQTMCTVGTDCPVAAAPRRRIMPIGPVSLRGNLFQGRT